MNIEKCKLILATSVDEFGDICTCIEDKGNGNAVAANVVDDEYESLFLSAPEMYKMLEKVLAEYKEMLGMSPEVNEIENLLAKARGES